MRSRITLSLASLLYLVSLGTPLLLAGEPRCGRGGGEQNSCDGVNIAARLNGRAEPGGIFVSGIVLDQVLD